MYSATDGKITIFSFPADNDEFEKQIRASTHTINNVTKYIGVCEKHSPTGHEKIRKKGSDRPRNSLSIFEGILKSFLLQTLYSLSRKVYAVGPNRKLIKCD